MTNKPTLEELKDYVFNKNKKYRFLCFTPYCGCEDGYCPKYDCYSIDKLKSYTDRQWKNAIKRINETYKDCKLEIEEYAQEIVDYLWIEVER